MKKWNYVLLVCLTLGLFSSCNEDVYPIYDENVIEDVEIEPSQITKVSSSVKKISDIKNWVGSGPYSSVLSIQWAETNGLQQPDDASIHFLAWGYKWVGKKTGLDLIRDVAAHDTRLFVVLTEQWGGWTIKGFGYDGNGDGHIRISNASLTLTEADFVNGIYTGNLDQDFDDMKTADAADLWMGGWYKAYASYWIGTPGVNVPASFSYSQYIASGRELENNSWDAWTFSTINSSEINVDPRPDLLEAAPMN